MYLSWKYYGIHEICTSLYLENVETQIGFYSICVFNMLVGEAGSDLQGILLVGMLQRSDEINVSMGV